jgi:CheY-like chemotaxis protein
MARILVVEDQRMTAEILRGSLESAGHVVELTDNGDRALALFRARPPDLVITDIVMPVLDGIELISAIRSGASNVPIIAISGGGHTGNFEFLEMARKLGAKEVLRKPVSREQLLAAVDRCLELRG